MGVDIHEKRQQAGRSDRNPAAGRLSIRCPYWVLKKIQKQRERIELRRRMQKW